MDLSDKREREIGKSDHCPFIEQKTFCSNCSAHCYRPDIRGQIQRVMRYSGPRILFHHPYIAICYLIESKKEKKTKRSAERSQIKICKNGMGKCQNNICHRIVEIVQIPYPNSI